MLNDKDDEKYESSEESEYHFSDEEAGYDVEPESVEGEAAPAPEAERSKNAAPAGERLAPSKRMMVSLVVFLGLVFAVYKIVAPTTPTQPTEIIAPAAVASKAVMSDVPPQQPVQAAYNTAAPVAKPVVASAPAVAQPAMPVQQPVVAPQTQAQQQTVAASAQPAAMPMPAAVSAETNMQPVAAPAPMTAIPAAAPNPPQPMAMNQPPVAAPQPMSQQPQPMAPEMTQQAMTAPQPSAPMPPANMQQPMQQQAAAPQAAGTPAAIGMPAVIPVQSPMTGYAAGPAGAQGVTEADVKMASMQADSIKLMSKLQTDYAQKITDFQSQNKALQDQVETLNSRIITMESQLNQLVQTLTRQQSQTQSNAQQAPSGNEAEIVAEPQPSMEQRIAYNVQAIIPGRAWLKSDNGETLTVAEGDTIKSLGRVTKIDPYDGVVEINTGRKIVSLSYGTGA